MSIKYSIKIENFAEHHFIKKFKKKYKNEWEITWRGILEEFERLDSLFSTSIAETIIDSEKHQIVKTEFRIAKSNESRKSSGNRCIIGIDKEKKEVNILLVYNKNDLGKTGETAEWKRIIKENYKQYSYLF